MGKIKSFLGPLSGRIGDMVFVQRQGENIVFPYRERTTPTTLNQKLAAATLGLIAQYASLHSKTIERAFSLNGCINRRNAFVKCNYPALKQALLPLAYKKVNNEQVCYEDVEAAVASFAAANPHALYASVLDGYYPMHLTGSWPEEMILEPRDAEAEPVKIKNEDGTLSEVLARKDRINIPSYDWSLPGVDTTPGTTPGSSDTTPQQVTLTTVASPSNGGTVTGGGTVNKGTQVTLKATPASGYTFSRWSDGNTSAQRTVTASADATYTAEFTQNGGSGGGSQGGYDSGN